MTISCGVHHNFSWVGVNMGVERLFEVKDEGECWWWNFYSAEIIACKLNCLHIKVETLFFLIVASTHAVYGFPYWA